MLDGKTLEEVRIDQINLEVAPQKKARQQSLVQQGQVDLICLRPTADGRYDIVDGRRRLVDLKEIGAETVEALVEEMDDVTLHVRALIYNTGTRNKLDEAEHMSQLLAEGWTQADISEHCGLSGASVSNTLRLLDLHPILKERLRDGSLCFSAAWNLARLPKDVQAQYSDQAKITSLNAEDAARQYEAGVVNLATLDIPELEDVVDVEPTGPGLFLTFAQMRAMFEDGKVEVKWEGKRIVLNAWTSEPFVAQEPEEK